ncbi:hypothetical protein KC323_g23 [Hortaea werneckii]|nr:hypothetical protein KC323_g23 [Hortaea werneckii]
MLSHPPSPPPPFSSASAASSSSSASSSSLSKATVRSSTSPSGIFARVAKASRTALFVLVSHTCTAPLLPATASRKATASSGAKFAEKTFPTPRSRLTTMLGPESEGSMFQSLTVRSELPALLDAVFRADIEVAVVVRVPADLFDVAFDAPPWDFGFWGTHVGGDDGAVVGAGEEDGGLPVQVFRSHSFTVLSADAEARRFWCCLFAANESTESTCASLCILAEDGSRIHAVDYIQVPQFDVRIHGTHSREVAALRCSVGLRAQPFHTERYSRQHHVVVDVEIICGIFVHIGFQMSHLVFYPGGEHHVVP